MPAGLDSVWMALFLAGLALLALSSLAALLAGDRSALAARLGAGGAVAGCALALGPAIAVLGGAQALDFNAPWRVPHGSLHLGVDALSAFFLVPVLLLGALCAIYGVEYLRRWHAAKAMGPVWACFNLLILAMAVVVSARNGLLFLVAWELMALSSFGLVVFHDERPEVRDAGWVYLVATHLGTAFLLPLFLLLGRHAGSFEFDRLAVAPDLAPGLAGALFVLALVGFGAKAGFMPFHVWLPEAHPAAPSHASALMSGVMIKTGIYGLVRILPFCGPPPAWWGWVLVAIGLSSGVLGVLFALAQHDLKRLLAYHSVENVGIIALGLGTGLLGLSLANPALAALGFAGGLLHVLNHALFKGLLFLGAGAVIHAVHTRDMDELGGLLRMMPVTGTTFLVGSVAIAGLPPLNGFVSEFLIYKASLAGMMLSSSGSAALVLVVAGLALIGGLAAACFAKAFGTVFLGLPRRSIGAAVRDPGLPKRISLVSLAVLCGLLGVFAPLSMLAVRPAVLAIVPDGGAARILDGQIGGLWPLTLVAALLVALVAGIAWLRFRLLVSRPVELAPTWDCGYAAPTARMQYTSSSFAQPLVRLFGVMLQTRRHTEPLHGPFPVSVPFHTDTPDVFRTRLFAPLYAGLRDLAGRLRWIQHGNLQLYVLYIALTLVALLVWKLG